VIGPKLSVVMAGSSLVEPGDDEIPEKTILTSSTFALLSILLVI
jgi:hypothetical protein